MKKILVTSTDVMMVQFLIPHILFLAEQGYYIEVACSLIDGHTEEIKARLNGKATIHFVNLVRSPFSKVNLNGLNQLRKIIKNNNFDLIWTNEPVMGIMTRLAARKARKKGTKVLYFAHGFHFFDGASCINWLIYYPIEKCFAKITDLLITINKEDFNRAKDKFHNLTVVSIPGIGINTSKFSKKNINIENKRKEINIPENADLLISVGELELRKNHITTIKAFAKMNRKNTFLIICGSGSQDDNLKTLIKELDMQDKIFLLGYRRDIGELCEASNLFVFSTYQEGLSVALMEAMSNGLPCVVSKIRGNIDLIEEDKGYYFSPHSIDECKAAIEKALNNRDKWKSIIQYNQNKIQEYDFDSVKIMISQIIKKLLS